MGISRGGLPGVILIVIGAALFAVQLLHLDADVIVLIIGLVFATAFVGTRRYGLLIPAAILTGLGTGILLEDIGYTRERRPRLPRGAGATGPRPRVPRDLRRRPGHERRAPAGPLVAAHPRHDPHGRCGRERRLRPRGGTRDRAGMARHPHRRRRLAAAAGSSIGLTEPTVARVVGERLRAAGVRYVTGHPGGEVVDLIEGFRQAGLEFVLTRHETTAACMSEASAGAA